MNDLSKIDEFLDEIDRKYSSLRSPLPRNKLEQQLNILNQEFDTLGLAEVNVTQPPSKLLEDVMANAFAMIQMYRKLLSGNTDLDLSCRYKDSKNLELEKSITSLKSTLSNSKSQNLQFERNVNKLNDNNTDLQKKITGLNKEMQQIKDYHKSKQNELTHKINRLENENYHLREMCGKDVDKYFSKEEKFLNVLRRYKKNEAVYKDALQKLEANNAEILNEILELKQELALAYLHR